MPPNRRRFHRLCLEPLEDRTVPSTWFVAPNGQDLAGGGGQGNPFGSIQFAVNTANSGDTIKVAAGTYTYNTAADQLQATLGAQVVVGIVGKQLTILGGYTTSDWTDANPTANPTIIDGQGKYRGAMVLGINAPTSLDLEGFTIQNGLGGGIPARGGSGALSGFGGGIFIDMGAEQNTGLTQVFRNDMFLNNQAVGAAATGGPPYTNPGDAAGGGIADVAGAVTLDTVTFSGNQALSGQGITQAGSAYGGGLYATTGATVTGNALTFTNNSATEGVAVQPYNPFAGGGTAEGGAAAMLASSTLTLTNTTATGNQATGGQAEGGYPGASGGSAAGGAFSAQQSTLSISDATINNNTATAGVGIPGGAAQGGGVASISSNLTLNRVTVEGNTAVSYNGGGGGGLYASGNANSVSITNAVVTDNVVQLGTRSSSQSGGGGMFLQDVSGTITLSTIANNTLGPGVNTGQGIFVDMVAQPTPSDLPLSLSYCIIANEQNSSGASALEFSLGTTRAAMPVKVVNLNTNLFAGNTSNDNIAAVDALMAPVIEIQGDSTDLTAPSAGFISPGSPNFNYGLLASSPARGQGNPFGSTVTVDRNQVARTSPNDLGAFQFVPPTLQFAQASYDFPEANAPATITLSMTQPAVSPVSFTLSITDGTAKAGVNYQSPASQVLTIPAGQSSVSFTVNLLDDGVKTGDLRVNFDLSQLSGAGGVVFGSQTAAVLTIDDKEPSDNEAFVSGLFHDTLNRAVDSTGLPFYTNLLNQLMVPILPTVMTYFVDAPEYQNLLVNGPGTGFFERYLGRTAGTSEAAYWVDQLQAGETDEQVIAGFVGSQEYFQNPAKGDNDNSTFVKSAYLDVLGRAADTGGLNFYLGLLNAGTATRQQIAMALLTSTENRTDLVNADFKTYLNRPVAAPDIAYWVGQIEQGVSDEQLIVRIGGSQEGYENNGNGNEQWIASLYNKVLGRNPQASEVQFYLNILTGGYQTERSAVAAAIASSTEARTDLIQADYQKYLGRAPSSAEVNTWLSAGFNAGMTDQQFTAQLVGSAEYFANPKKGNNDDLTWLRSAYQDIVGMPLDSASQSFYVGQLVAGVPLPTVAFRIATSDAAYTGTVQNLFQTYLRRTAAANDLAFWVVQFMGGQTQESILGGIIGSQEYFFDPHQFP